MENRAMDTDALRDSLLDAALGHVPFDGWSAATFQAAATEAGIELALAKAICPRGAADLAVAYHRRGDRQMEARLKEANLQAMRFRERVAAAVRFRLEAADKEIVRRGAALFALPQYGATGAQLLWGTADAIWRALGDTSDDLNWYTKRATLSGVYGATVLYWLGDTGEGNRATWDFLDRRIEDVMRIEKLKAQVNEHPVLSKIVAGPAKVLSRIRAPGKLPDDLPGRWGR